MIPSFQGLPNFKWLRVDSNGAGLAPGAESGEIPIDPAGAVEIVSIFGAAYDQTSPASAQQNFEKIMLVEIIIGEASVTDRNYVPMAFVAGTGALPVACSVKVPAGKKIIAKFKNGATAGGNSIYGILGFGVRPMSPADQLDQAD